MRLRKIRAGRAGRPPRENLFTCVYPASNVLAYPPWPERAGQNIIGVGMHTYLQTQQQSQQQQRLESAAELVLHIARNLHRAVNADALAISLPVLRRLLATKTLTEISLPELQRRRDIVQRKHVLRMLAVEAGFNCWEDYRHALDAMNPDQVSHFDQLSRSAGYPNLWFSSFDEAQDYAWEITVGQCA